MEMNPYKPLVQFCEGLYKKKLYIKTSMHNFNLKITLDKTNSWNSTLELNEFFFKFIAISDTLKSTKYLIYKFKIFDNFVKCSSVVIHVSISGQISFCL